MARNLYLMDPTVPRPAPLMPKQPTPFNFEKPVPQVPEVSLIFDSSATSHNNSNHNCSSNRLSAGTTAPQPSPPGINNGNSSRTCQPQSELHNPPQPNNFEARVLYDVMKKQEEMILRLESQVKAMHDSHESQWKSVQTLLTTLVEQNSTKSPPKCEQAVQTDAFSEPQNVSGKVVSKDLKRPSNSGTVGHVRQQDALPAIERCRSSSSSSSSSSLSSNILSPEKPSSNSSSKKSVPSVEGSQNKSVVEERKAEDLSAILKDLQLPTIQENSIFSEVSIRSIDLQEYNDSFNDSKSDIESPDVGPSASNFGSSDEEEVVQPTVTFYRNVIGNVNKMLEGNQEITMYGSTDTTVYGMSSTNLSFATKQYLQKYGLVKHREAPKENHVPNRKKTASNNNRILDVTDLKNKPKFI